MRSSFIKIHQQAAYIKAQRLVCLLLLAEYAKWLKELLPPAGSITGTFPDENGLVTITATQGSAEANATVLIINDTTGEIVSVTPQSNGSFTAKITAQLGDEIKIVLMDSAGNQTTVSYITFKGTDGKYLVTAKGGIVEGEGGTKLIIPEGALSGPAVIKITPVTQCPISGPLGQLNGMKILDDVCEV